MKDSIMFKNAEMLMEFTAIQVAEFIQANLTTLGETPTDYDDCYNYIHDKYLAWLKGVDKPDEE